MLSQSTVIYEPGQDIWKRGSVFIYHGSGGPCVRIGGYNHAPTREGDHLLAGMRTNKETDRKSIHYFAWAPGTKLRILKAKELVDMYVSSILVEQDPAIEAKLQDKAPMIRDDAVVNIWQLVIHGAIYSHICPSKDVRIPLQYGDEVLRVMAIQIGVVLEDVAREDSNGENQDSVDHARARSCTLNRAGTGDNGGSTQSSQVQPTPANETPVGPPNSQNFIHEQTTETQRIKQELEASPPTSCIDLTGSPEPDIPMSSQPPASAQPLSQSQSQSQSQGRRAERAGKIEKARKNLELKRLREERLKAREETLLAEEELLDLKREGDDN